MGHVELDQVAFKGEGFELGLDEHDVEVVGFFHHGADLGGVTAPGLEVLGDAVV